jgi:hypothetical protein
VIRRPYVAGSFYPASRATLQRLVDRLYGQAAPVSTRHARPMRETPPRGILVPHAGLEWSGAVAAAGWRALADLSVLTGATSDATVVILGTNHSARLEGVGVWPGDAWRTPLGDVAIDRSVAKAIAALGSPYELNEGVHLREHSIEVQLPLLQAAAPGVRIVPLAVSAGTGEAAVDAGVRLGQLITELDRPARRVLLAISTDLAHYPRHPDCVRVTADLLPTILDLDPVDVAATERELRGAGIPGLACGMCGIEPTVLGLAALRAMRAVTAAALASATSADAGGPPDRTVGYLSVVFG